MDWLVTPISEAAPCGPDLELEDDADFAEYYYDAMGRLPDRYITPGMRIDDRRTTEAVVFDPKSVDLKAEVAQIEPLLRRSRDLRLLVLRAHWECLAGRIEPLAATLTGAADLLETFGDAVHPAMPDRGQDRREALADLVQPQTMLLPLQFMSLTGTSEVTLRRFRVAEGKLTPIESEQDLSVAAMRDALRHPASRKQVDTAHGAISAMLAALSRIVQACKAGPAQPFTPSFDPLVEVLDEMREAIWEARVDLRNASAAEMPAAPEPAAEGPAGDTAAAPAAAPAQAALPSVQIADHAQARATLSACEAYFRDRLPSSPAVLLVVQARLLIGRPLTEALEVLLPEEAKRTIVEFGPQSGFALGMDRLRALTQQAALPEAPQTEDATKAAPVTSMADLSAAIRGVEAFFQSNERSSPVPLLLQRARSFLDKDFQQLVEELIPVPSA